MYIRSFLSAIIVLKYASTERPRTQRGVTGVSVKG